MITARHTGPAAHIQAVIDAGIIPALVPLARTAQFDLKTEVRLQPAIVLLLLCPISYGWRSKPLYFLRVSGRLCNLQRYCNGNERADRVSGQPRRNHPAV